MQPIAQISFISPHPAFRGISRQPRCGTAEHGRLVLKIFYSSPRSQGRQGKRAGRDLYPQRSARLSCCLVMWLDHPDPGRPWSVSLHVLKSRRFRYLRSSFFYLHVFFLLPNRNAEAGRTQRASQGRFGAPSLVS